MGSFNISLCEKQSDFIVHVQSLKINFFIVPFTCLYLVLISKS